MAFNMKKLMNDAGTLFNRAVQFTEEKLGTSEKTELDANFENLSQRSDVTKNWTEKMLADAQAVLQPNPAYRAEDFLMDKIEKRRPNRLTNLEYLGLDMIEAGNAYGPGGAYGSTLVKVGMTQQKLGQAERDFLQAAASGYIHPLQRFLDGDMKTIVREKKVLEAKRLDLDACKNRLRKAKSLEGQTNLKEGVNPQELIAQAERDLRTAQSEFDRQVEVTRLLLEGVSGAHANHLSALREFIDAQVRFHAQSHAYMQDLQRELGGLSFSTTAPFAPAATPPVSGTDENRNANKRARVLYDYDAEDPTELSLQLDEIITVVEDPTLGPDHVRGERGSQTGKVHRSYINILK